MTVTRAWLTFCGVFVLSLLARLPFFFPAVINWDESTFILIGQSLLDGHLPYVQLWDVKPPLLFVVFAAALKLFGHSIAGVRLAGTLCVAVTAFLVLRISARWWGQAAGWFAAGLCILGMSLIDSAQATLSEHVMLPALAGALWLWLGDRESASRSFWIGALMSAATLVRLNMSFAVVAMGLVMLGAGLTPGVRRWRQLTAYVAGGLAVVGATALPYLVTGQHAILWKSAVVGAIARSRSENSAWGNLVGQLRSAFGISPADSVPWLIPFVWIAGVAGLLLIVSTRDRDGLTPRALWRLTMLTIATVAGILLSGGGHPHYQIQLVPLAAIYGAALVRASYGRWRWAVWSLAVVAAAASLGPLTGEYGRMISRIRARDGVRSGHVYDLAAWLERENPGAEPVYLLHDHITYWLNGWTPPTRLAHPSTIAKPELLEVLDSTPADELRRVFDRSPKFVVIHKQTWFMDARLDQLLQGHLRDGYRLDAEVHDRQIYRRVKVP